MRKFILLLISILCIQNLLCQTNYYPNEEGVVVREDYTYKYNPSDLGLHTRLYNINSVYYKIMDVSRLDGTKESYDQLQSNQSGVDGATYTKSYINNLIKSKFTSEHISLIQYTGFKGLGIKLTINTTTGNVADVVFGFSQYSNFKYIPIEVYRSIELDLKDKLVYYINEHGKKYNYGMVDWYVSFD